MRKGRVCYMEVLFWLGIMVTFLIIEAITVGLTTIWFAIGAFFAMIAAALGVMTPIQIVIFFEVHKADCRKIRQPSQNKDKL